MELQLKNLTKKYKEKVAVNHVNTTFTPGIYGLLGANKTIVERISDNEDLNKLEKNYWIQKALAVDTPFEYGYALGWSNFGSASEMLIVCIIGICIAIAPVFAEEYRTGTASIILSTRYGKNKVITAKIISALLFSTIIFLINAFIAIVIPLDEATKEQKEQVQYIGYNDGICSELLVFSNFMLEMGDYATTTTLVGDQDDHSKDAYGYRSTNLGTSVATYDLDKDDISNISYHLSDGDLLLTEAVDYVEKHMKEDYYYVGSEYLDYSVFGIDVRKLTDIRQNLSMKMRKKESGGIFSRFIVGLYTIFLLRTQVYLNTERCILMWMRLQVILLPWYIRIRQVTVILVRKINEKGNSFREIPDLYCWDYVIVFYKSFSGK